MTEMVYVGLYSIGVIHLLALTEMRLDFQKFIVWRDVLLPFRRQNHLVRACKHFPGLIRSKFGCSFHSGYSFAVRSEPQRQAGPGNCAEGARALQYAFDQSFCLRYGHKRASRGLSVSKS